MSITTRVLLDPDRMPSAAEWARAIREQGFEMDFVVPFDPWSQSGFLPCLHQGQPAGFEYDVSPHSAVADEVRRAAGPERTLEVTFVTHSEMRELVSGMIASGVLALLADGIVWSDESGESVSGIEAIEIARATEREL